MLALDLTQLESSEYYGVYAAKVLRSLCLLNTFL